QAYALYNGFFDQYLNQWVHVAGVFKPGQAVELYIKGQLVDSDTTDVPAAIGDSGIFRIGARADNYLQGNWDGQIDTVQLFGSALNAAEIQTSHTAAENSDALPMMHSRKTTYSLAGQAIAVRVTGDLDGNDGLYYMHSDHLGSASAMSDADGALVPDSLARYTPFGDWRTEPTAGLTDQGYTGHKHNNLGGGADDLGLIYMNARY
ncbi:MAG: LamG domain-containing protein, partial [Chloroflexi bacterium]|nr:LamG domain-containing protein [Chloroflexota bacterium]